MPVIQKIKGVISPADKTTFKANIDGDKAIIAPFAVLASPGQNSSGQRLGVLNTGYVRESCKTAEDFSDIMPKKFSIPDFRERLTLYDDLEELENYIMSLVEEVRDTRIQVGIDLMDDANQVYKQVKSAAKNDEALEAPLKKLEKRYEKTKAPVLVETIAKSGSISVTGVVDSSILINKGSTVIVAKLSPELSSKLKINQPITIDPYNSVQLPAGWTSIIIENLSATTEGSFSVKTVNPK